MVAANHDQEIRGSFLQTACDILDYVHVAGVAGEPHQVRTEAIESPIDIRFDAGIQQPDFVAVQLEAGAQVFESKGLEHENPVRDGVTAWRLNEEHFHDGSSLSGSVRVFILIE
jgi:hypothetical protein